MDPGGRYIPTVDNLMEQKQENEDRSKKIPVGRMGFGFLLRISQNSFNELVTGSFGKNMRIAGVSESKINHETDKAMMIRTCFFQFSNMVTLFFTGRNVSFIHKKYSKE